MVCTVEILPVWVSQRLRLPSVSPMMTKWPHAAMAVATPSDELDMRPQEGRFGLVSVTCTGTGAPCVMQGARRGAASWVTHAHAFWGPLQKALVVQWEDGVYIFTCREGERYHR